MALEWLPDYVAVDIETSGLAAQEDDLLEIAGVKFVAGVPVDRFTTTLQSSHALGLRTARMTGLTDSALAEGLPAQEALRALDAFAGALPLVAHNVSLDREFLIRFTKDLADADFTDNPWWDSLELAALVFPELDSLALEHVASALKLEITTLHRAEADAELAGYVFAGLYAHIAEHWPATLITAIRETHLADHPFGMILQRLPLDAAPAPTAAPTPFTPYLAPVEMPLTTAQPRTLTVRRADADLTALAHFRALGDSGPARLIFPPQVYPGGFHGPDKEFRAHCEQLDVPCYPGRQSLLHPGKLALLLAGGVAVPGGLSDFERALLLAWGTTSPTGDYTRLSWWVLNNYPTLATALNALNALECSSLPTPDPRSVQPGVIQAATTAGAVPWDVPVATTHPFTPDPTLGRALAGPVAHWAVTRPEYWPLHALRGLRLSLPCSATHLELAWLEAAGAATPIAAWWTTHGTALLALLAETEAALATYGSSTQHPGCTTRGEEVYWPLIADPAHELDPAPVTLAVHQLAAGCADHLPELIALAAQLDNTAALEPLATAIRRFETLGAIATQFSAAATDWTLVVLRRQAGKEAPWWSLEGFPPLDRDLAAHISGTGDITLYSTFLDEEDWRLTEKVWGATPATLTFVDEAAPIPAGNTIHLPLMPPGIRSLPAKKVWQNWQLSILRRLLQTGSGRWLIVARNPQDVATLQYRLRDPMVKAGWQPLFQRHDGTKGFLMREFGGFEKVVMVGTGEILQELDHFPTPPDTLAILHVPTRPPNDLACVALQHQMGLTSDAFRDEVIFPLGVLDLKRALYHWAPFREGAAAVYLLDYRQLDQPELRGLINQSFPNQNLLETQPAARY